MTDAALRRDYERATAKLTEVRALVFARVKELHDQGVPYSQIAATFGLTKGRAQQIVEGKPSRVSATA